MVVNAAIAIIQNFLNQEKFQERRVGYIFRLYLLWLFCCKKSKQKSANYVFWCKKSLSTNFCFQIIFSSLSVLSFEYLSIRIVVKRGLVQPLRLCSDRTKHRALSCDPFKYLFDFGKGAMIGIFIKRQKSGMRE